MNMPEYLADLAIFSRDSFSLSSHCYRIWALYSSTLSPIPRDLRGGGTVLGTKRPGGAGRLVE